MNAKEQERQTTCEDLQEYLKPGTEVYTILRHVSRSGMLRVIDLVTFASGRPSHCGWNAAKALGWAYHRGHNGVKMEGCGMDMGFHLVYSLARVLFPDGFGCIGKRCPSNDHHNGDGVYTPHHHQDGGYALIQRWL